MCDPRVAYNHTKKVLKLHLHPKYYSDRKSLNAVKSLRVPLYDIAILEIQPFTLSDELNILPGCLFESNDNSFGDRLLAAGRFWFATFSNSSVNCSRLTSYILH